MFNRKKRMAYFHDRYHAFHSIFRENSALCIVHIFRKRQSKFYLKEIHHGMA